MRQQTLTLGPEMGVLTCSRVSRNVFLLMVFQPFKSEKAFLVRSLQNRSWAALGLWAKVCFTPLESRRA